jgi:hypothetical protein
VSKIPAPLSEGEELLALELKVAKWPPPVREYRFCEGRKWRFDFSWVDILLAVEVQGGTQWGKSDHSKGAGIERDYEKLNTAQLLGWTVLQFSTAMVKDGRAIQTLSRIFEKET